MFKKVHKCRRIYRTRQEKKRKKNETEEEIEECLEGSSRTHKNHTRTHTRSHITESRMLNSAFVPKSWLRCGLLGAEEAEVSFENDKCLTNTHCFVSQIFGHS